MSSRIKTNGVTKGSELMADFNFTSKYARFLPDKQRREKWEEAIDRMREMHKKKYKKYEIDKVIDKAFDMVRDKKILASQRAMQFGGPAVEQKHMRIFNCTATFVDRARVFAECLYMFLCGCGVGYSVQNRHMSRLPNLIDTSKLTNKETVFEIPDTIEGWCDAADVLIASFFEDTEHSGINYKFNYSKIRPEGAPLSHGGKAPGPDGLKRSLDNIKEILLDRVQHGRRRLRSIDAYDIICHLAEAVLSGGVRRSASICLFDMDDELMINAKTGQWFSENPQRGRSNNSVVILRDSVSREKFQLIMERVKQYGEPGFAFLSHPDHCYNPCFEISLCPIAIYRPTDKEKISKIPQKYQEYCKTSKRYKGPLVERYTHELLNEREKFERYGFKYVSGFQCCNLTEINCRAIKNKEDWKQAVWGAATIGTLQCGYTKPGYLDEASRHIIEREALIGVSMTGMQDNPDIVFDEKMQQEMAQYATEVNKELAFKLGFNQAARTTCVKPAGNSSVLLQCASGIHPHHARRYFRRVQVNRFDSILKYFVEHNSHAVEPSVWSAGKTDFIITFPVKIDEKSRVVSDFTALEFLKYVELTQRNWVKFGTARPESTEGLNHNVSNTIKMNGDEWDDVADFLYDHRDLFSGIALLPITGDKIYKQAPMEACWFRKDLIKKYGEDNVKFAEKMHDAILNRFNRAKSIQDVRFKLTLMDKLYNKYTRKFEWIMQNCKPLTDANNQPIEPKYEFETRCDMEYLIILAIYKDIRKNMTIDNIETVLDLIASVKDEERWFDICSQFKKIDYSVLKEEKDDTNFVTEAACAGGKCDLIL